GAVAVAGLGPSLLHGALSAEAGRFAGDERPQLAKLTGWLASGAAPASDAAEATTPAPDAGETKAEPDAKTDEAPKEPAADEGAEKPADAKAPVKPVKPAGDRKAQSPAELFSSYAPSVVTIKVSGLRGNGAGTGFFVDDKGTVATNQHVIDHADAVSVKFFDGSTNAKVELIAEDADMDLALLHVELDGPSTPVVLGDSDGVTVGEEVIVIGNPLGLEHTLTDGLVSSRRLYKGKKFIQMSAPVSPGNSGGPVFNGYGDVVGVTVAKVMMGLGENLNLAIPVNELKKMLEAEHDAPRRFGASSW
ncbi:MAG: trypsin-like peptidase domain-containing protein, partial [Myxococcales bacterium]|nr:trypsin-like peptidase domain-containing protein [Myxococcales bacterium]